MITTEYMRKLLQRCIEEDGGIDGDVTTNSLHFAQHQSAFALHVRGSGIVAGLDPIAEVIDVFGDVSISLLHHDGDEVKDENIAILSGVIQSILFAERTILNIIGHASGVATRTKLFVDEVAGTNCKVCDTRKTTPGLRALDKYAVVCGGGTSHRMGLHDAALYKDNHLVDIEDFIDELGAAIASAKSNSDLKFIEVEVDTLEQLKNVLLLPVDIVLLDNMPLETVREAVVLRDASNTSVLLEASGGVTLESIHAIAQTGVDRVSVGGLTHQAIWLDVGLDAIHG